MVNSFGGEGAKYFFVKKTRVPSNANEIKAEGILKFF